MTSLVQHVVARLGQFSTCEISDALIKLKHPHGGFLPGIQMWSPQHDTGPTRICGPAFTVKMVSQADKDAPKPSQHFVDAAEEDSIMVISAPPYVRSAIWGGLMTARAQAKGVKGVVLDGRCRDLSEHREAGFPVFARSHSTLGQSPFTRPSELQVPLTISDPSFIVPYDAPRLADSSLASSSTLPNSFPPLTLHPGDYIVGDLDGVVVVPRSEAEKVIELAQKGREVDERCMADLRAGRSVKETFAEHRGK